MPYKVEMEKAVNEFVERHADTRTREECEAYLKGKLVKCCFCENYSVFGTMKNKLWNTRR